MCVGNVFERRVPTWTFSPYGLAPIFVAVSIINIQRNMTDEKNDKPYKKNLEHTAQIIHELTQEKVTIPGLPFTEKEGQFVFEEFSPSFLLRPKDGQVFFDALFDGPYWYDSLEVSTKSGSYKIPQAHLSFPENPFSSSPVDGCYRCSVRFKRLMDSRWDERTEYYYRYILPVKDHKWKDFIERPISDYLHISPDHVKPIYWALVRIDFPEKRQIHLFQPYYQPYNDTDESDFLVIESQFPCTHSAMGKYMYPISLSLGLVTSVAPFDYAIVVASKTPEFDGEIMGGIVKLRPTIKSKRRFFTTDIDSLYRRLEGKADYTLHQLCDKNGKAKSRLDPMTEQEFSALARMLYENKALARATLILLLASNEYALMGATYSLVLETICSALVEDETGAYMESKDWKSVLPKLKKTLSDFCKEHSITDEHKDVMIKKLDGFNSKTNGNKLTTPFEQIGYKLSGPEKEVIRDRNRFLHGKIYERLPNESWLKDKLLYSSMELRKLCGILLFRTAGFKGPIFNNAIELELEEALANKEPLFITYEEKTEAPQPTEKPEASV